MTHYQMEQLLHALKYHLPMDVRHKIMRELPQAYNAWVGHEVVVVNYADQVMQDLVDDLSKVQEPF